MVEVVAIVAIVAITMYMTKTKEQYKSSKVQVQSLHVFVTCNDYMLALVDCACGVM